MNFTTIYLTSDIVLSIADINYYEKATGAEIAMGAGFINVYTKDKRIIRDVVYLIGGIYVQEIAG